MTPADRPPRLNPLQQRVRVPFGRGVRVLGTALGLFAFVFTWLGSSATAARAQSTLSAIEDDVERIAHRARPCMLTVIAQRSMPARPGTPRRTTNRIGSGVAVSTNGVLTTATVVLGAERVYVLTDNHLQVEAHVVGMDPVRNLALLRADQLELSSLPLANKPGESGDWVIAMGNSYGGSPTQSVGTVALRFEEPGTSLLQLTNEVHPGNSGGAALNSRGELLGLVQGELGAPEAPGQRDRAERRPGGMSFAIPIDVIVPFLDDLAKYQRVRHGLFGVTTRGAFVNGADASERIPIGALVEAVQPGGPAARVGLKKGDLIVAFNGERVEYPEQLARWVAVAGPGAVISLVWVRDEIRQEGRTKLDEAPSAIPSWMRVDSSSNLSAGAGPGGLALDASHDRRPSRALRERSGAADTTSR
jgi:serine protease Do